MTDNIYSEHQSIHYNGDSLKKVRLNFGALIN